MIMSKIQLKPEAVRLLRAVQKQIRKAPTSFDMSVIAEKAKYKEITASVILNNELLPPCGTTACIAGWVLIKSNQPFEGNSPLSRAADILGLNNESDGSDYGQLFLSSKWPKYSKRDNQLMHKLFRLDKIRDDKLINGRSTRIINSRIKRVIKERGQLAIKRI